MCRWGFKLETWCVFPNQRETSSQFTRPRVCQQPYRSVKLADSNTGQSVPIGSIILPESNYGDHSACSAHLKALARGENGVYDMNSVRREDRQPASLQIYMSREHSKATLWRLTVSQGMNSDTVRRPLPHLAAALPEDHGVQYDISADALLWASIDRRSCGQRSVSLLSSFFPSHRPRRCAIRSPPATNWNNASK